MENKKYKIEIWKYHNVSASYEDNDINKVLIWYLKNWKYVYDNGGCAFYLFKNGKKLDFDKCYELGFYD